MDSSVVMPTSEILVPKEQQKNFRKSLVHLLGINALSTAVSVANEVVLGHSAMGFSQATMELTDTFMAGGLEASHRNDIEAKHKKASGIRQTLYSLHVGTAALGIFEGARLMNNGIEPTFGNIAVSGLIAALNTHYLYHRRKHKKHTAHMQNPDLQMAYEDPIEVVEDRKQNFPTAAYIHKLNEDGTTAIAQTNLIEAAGGIAGTVAQFGWEQGSATAAIASSLGVITVMIKQIYKERHVQAPATIAA